MGSSKTIQYIWVHLHYISAGHLYAWFIFEGIFTGPVEKSDRRVLRAMSFNIEQTSFSIISSLSRPLDLELYGTWPHNIHQKGLPHYSKHISAYEVYRCGPPLRVIDVWRHIYWPKRKYDRRVLRAMACAAMTLAKWGQRDSNSQSSDLESDALPLRHSPCCN